MNAQDAANKLLAKYGVVEPAVPIEEMVASEDILVARHSFAGTESGFAMKNGNTKVIGINSAHSRRRQRFTIAHELGHLVLHTDRQLTVDHAVYTFQRNDDSSLGTHPQEVQANAFAAAVLMPENLVTQALWSMVDSGSGQREVVTSQLARVFDVSNEAMNFRLINLGVFAN